MLVSLMPESGGDNAMWKERAVSLVGSMMPCLTWKRDNQEIPMSVRTIRDYLSLNNVIKLARDETVPAEIRAGMTGYLDTLPGFIGEAYDDEGVIKPPGPDTPQYNTETASQQHGYLAMQFTRSLQSLGDDYGYIFDTQAADVDMVDVVLNRRILVVLVPALEKSGDEVANLGKIVSASIKGMMGSTLGSTVEGDSSSVIENKPTHSSTPFMTVFDEVGYYVAEGMAVMAAQARSLGFSLVFAGQDLPAMKKRVREEAQSITANCNIKLFGKLEDPTETKDFFEKTVGSAMVTEVSGFQMSGGGSNYHDTKQAGVQLRPRASYDGLRGFKEGQAVITFGEVVVDCAVFYSNPGFAKAMRVTRYMSLPPPEDSLIKHAGAITKLRDLMVNKTWTALRADVAVETSAEIAAMNDGFVNNNKEGVNPVDAGIAALVQIHAVANDIPPPSENVGKSTGGSGGGTGGVTPPVTAQPAASPAVQTQASPLAATRPADAAATAQQGDKPPPSVFGGSPASTQDEALVKAAQDVKENLFGSSNKKDAVTSAEPQSAAAQDEALVKAAQDVKENLFGSNKKDAVPPSAALAKPPAESGSAKPSIFGSAPAKPAEAPAAPATPPQAPPVESKAPEVPPAVAPAKTPAESGSAKPSIFGSAPAKPAEAPAAPATPPQAPPVESKAPEVPPAVAPAKPPAESGSAKPSIFGSAPAKPAEAPAAPATPLQAPPVESKAPEVPPAAAPAKTPAETQQSEEKKPDNGGKPSIFGGGTTSKDEDGKE